MRPIIILIATVACAQAIPTIVRPDFQNLSRPDLAAGSPVVSSNGGIAATNLPSDGLNHLQQYLLGDNFGTYHTPYRNADVPGEAFADDVLINGRDVIDQSGVITTVAPVFPVLYPTGFGTASGVTVSGAELLDPSTGGAFRYRWLMYGPDPSLPDDGSPGYTPTIIHLFGNQGSDDAGWFTDADRTAAIGQIAVLREALALDPLNDRLQAALLDIHYDLGVAEMQLVRRQLIKLGRLRLGLDTPTPFIIDEEIAIYEKMVERTAKVLALYGELFTFPMEGFNPTDLYRDTIAAGGPDPSKGAPFGYFVFRNAQPFRSQIPSQYVEAGTSETVNIVDPGDATTTFQGYKDYRSLLTILGQYIQFQADLARSRAMRRRDTPSGSDITLARDGLQAAEEAVAIATTLNHMFSDRDFDDPQFDDTGIRAARQAVANATNSVTEVRKTINGESNVIGLDPNFLLLFPADGGNADSYDILDDILTRTSNGQATGPLAVALRDLGYTAAGTLTGGGAVQLYSDFRESVDNVQVELNALNTAYANRFAVITGYSYDTEFAQWDGQNPKAGIASDLARVRETIASLERQKDNLDALRDQRAIDIAATDKAVSLASGIGAAVQSAEASYLTRSSSSWKEIHQQEGRSAAAQAVADGALTGATLDNPFSAGVQLAVIAVATGINAGVQEQAARRISNQQENLEKYALQRESQIFAANLPLVVQEARLALGDLQREATAHGLEVENNLAAISQALAERDALLREVERELSNLAASRHNLANRYHADPIHLIRSENAILTADAGFRNAQRWTFYTCRALEYKWNDRFSYADSGDVALGISFDIGSILSARNASELERIRIKMAAFNLARINTLSNPTTTVISLKDHVLSRNPDDPDLTFDPLLFPDKGLRPGPDGGVVDQLTHFRNVLESHRTTGNNFSIPVDTTRLSNVDVTFFTGPNFSNPGNPESGNYRNKIVWVAVNIVAADGGTPSGPASPTAGKGGRIVYGGNTLFRTRVPICPDRTPGAAVDPGKDFSSEYIVQPFRYFESPTFDGQFNVFDRQNVGTFKMAYSGAGWEDTAVREAITSSALGQSGFRREDLRERSVAATRWRIEINSIDLNQVTDIELIISHVFSSRATITCE